MKNLTEGQILAVITANPTGKIIDQGLRGKYPHTDLPYIVALDESTGKQLTVWFNNGMYHDKAVK